MALGIPNEELIQRAQYYFDAAEAHKQSRIISQWDNNLRHYHGQHIYEPRPGRSRLFIPKTRTSVNRVVASAMETFFSGYDIATVEPRTGPAVEGAKAREELVNYRLNGNPIQFSAICRQAFENALVYNFAPAKIWWEKQVRRVRRTVQIADAETDQILGERDVEIELPLVSEPRMEIIPPEQFFIDGRVCWHNYQDATFMIHRFYKPIQEVMEAARNGVYEGKGVDLLLAALSDDEQSSQVAIQRMQNEASFAAPRQELDNVQLLEVWERTEVDTGAGKRLALIRYVVVPPVAVLQGPDVVPYQHGNFPFVIGFATPEANKLYSDSFVHLIKHLQMEINGIRNQRRDNVAYLLNNHLLVSRQARVNLNSLRNSRPGGITEVDGDPRGATSPVVAADYTNRSVEEESLADRDIQEFTGVTSDALGLASRRRQELATVTMTRLDQRQVTESLILRTLAETFVQPACEMLMQLEEQYESDDDVYRWVGHRMGVGAPEDDVPSALEIRGKYRVRVQVGIGGVSKDVKVRNLTFLMSQFFQVFGPQPQLAAEFFREIGPLMGIKDIDRFVGLIQQAQPAALPAGAGAASGASGEQGAPPLAATDVSGAKSRDVSVMKGLASQLLQ